MAAATQRPPGACFALLPAARSAASWRPKSPSRKNIKVRGNLLLGIKLAVLGAKSEPTCKKRREKFAKFVGERAENKKLKVNKRRTNILS